MPGVQVRVLTFAIGVAFAVGVALQGCGGQLPMPGGRAGKGGSTTPTGQAGVTGRGGVGAGGRAGGPGGTGGTVSTGGSGTGFGQPACPAGVVQAAPCTPADIQLCYRTCGPEQVGVRSVTCSGTSYSQMSGCAFDPGRDYSCYAIPSGINQACPQGITPQASQPCTTPRCMLCNSVSGLTGGQYLDSTGAPKVGWCVCQQPDAAGVRTWSCASDTSWPCPLGAGCAGSVSTGTGGSGPAGTGGSGSGFGEPACASTVVKGGACTAADQQFCYKTCGPEKTGVKTETCTTAGTYAEMSGCSFNPSLDYSCYRIPTVPLSACPPQSTPMASGPCDLPHCLPCNSLQGQVGGQYIDSTGAPKVGWCVCQVPDAAGMRTWSCASDTQWPCPLGEGC